MLNRFITVLSLIHLIFGYSIFNHTQDFRIPSSTYISSNNFVQNLYNFSNPACNQNTHEFIYSSFGNYYNGILNEQQLLFSIKNSLIDQLHLALLRTSIDNNYDTSSAWNDDNQNDMVDINEIDYNQIGFFSDRTLGLIISKPFSIRNIDLGINSKFSVSSISSEKSFYHAFDFGFLYSHHQLQFSAILLNSNFGFVIKDLIAYSHWSTGQIDQTETTLILGTVFNFKLSSESNINRNIYWSTDFNIINSQYSIGLEYQFNIKNKLLSFHIEDSKLKNSLSFLIQFNNQFDIAYSFIIPKNNELETSQKIILGLNPNIFK